MGFECSHPTWGNAPDPPTSGLHLPKLRLSVLDQTVRRISDHGMEGVLFRLLKPFEGVSAQDLVRAEFLLRVALFANDKVRYRLAHGFVLANASALRNPIQCSFGARSLRRLRHGG